MLRGLARKKLDLIASIGFRRPRPCKRSPPNSRTCTSCSIDGVAKGKNVNSVLFKEQEGSYLVGVAAAMASKTKKIGFVGGMDIPLIRAFACGYAQGAKADQPESAKCCRTWSAPPARPGTTRPRAANWRARSSTAASTWCSPSPAARGMGTLQTAKEKGKLAIGVDSNQNYLHPGTMLTSMVKRVDNAIYDAFMEVEERHLVTPGVTYRGPEGRRRRLGAGQGQPHAVVTPEIEKRVNAAKADIINGKIKVVDYRAASSCPD